MPLVPIHVLAGTIAIVAGFIALYSVKGLKLHRKSGMVFVCVMLVMSLSGTVMAFGHPGTALNVPAARLRRHLWRMCTALSSPPDHLFWGRSGVFPSRSASLLFVSFRSWCS